MMTAMTKNAPTLLITAREDSPVEARDTLPPKTKSKPTRGRQKRTIENEDAPRQTAWTNAVENEEGYDVGCRTYDMVNGIWKRSWEGSDKRYKTYGSSSFNAEYREASINMNVDVGDDDGEWISGQFSTTDCQDQAKRCYEEGRVEIIGSSSYDHLIGDVRTAMEALRAEIKAKYNLSY
ncbi:hypothetical protein Tco_0583358 [Tanacetum coccineum]